jgi:hypothetical protein
MNILYKAHTAIFLLAVPVLAHGDDPSHQHGSPQKAAPVTNERPSASGKSFDIVLEVCEEDKVYLQVANAEDNQPVSEAQIDVSVSGDVTSTLKAEVTKTPGIYSLPLIAKVGNKIIASIKITTPSTNETLTLTIPHWPKPSGKCAY